MALAVQFARDQRKVTPSSWRGQVCPSLSHIARNLCSAISPSLAWASTAITLPSQKRRAATQCRIARATLRVRTAARTSAAARTPHAAGQRRHPGRSWCDDGWCTSCRCVPASSLGALSGSAHTQPAGALCIAEEEQGRCSEGGDQEEEEEEGQTGPLMEFCFAFPISLCSCLKQLQTPRWRTQIRCDTSTGTLAPLVAVQ